MNIISTGIMDKREQIMQKVLCLLLENEGMKRKFALSIYSDGYELTTIYSYKWFFQIRLLYEKKGSAGKNYRILGMGNELAGSHKFSDAGNEVVFHEAVRLL